MVLIVLFPKAAGEVNTSNWCGLNSIDPFITIYRSTIVSCHGFSTLLTIVTGSTFMLFDIDIIISIHLTFN